ncbi:hypothetical protein HK096_008372 [Nowakowskiella sp. JEL0078]|nr:hypothetical protein HK096_008372 [Nowakowskiella sp. JEL0078]
MNLILADSVTLLSDFRSTLFYAEIFPESVPKTQSYAAIFREILIEEENFQLPINFDFGSLDLDPDIDDFSIRVLSEHRFLHESAIQRAAIERQRLRTRALLAWAFSLFSFSNVNVINFSLSSIEIRQMRELHSIRGRANKWLVSHAMELRELGISEGIFLQDVNFGNLATAAVSVLHSFVAYTDRMVAGDMDWMDEADPPRVILAFPPELNVRDRKKLHILAEQSMLFHSSFELQNGRILGNENPNGDFPTYRQLFVSRLPFDQSSVDIENNFEEAIFGGALMFVVRIKIAVGQAKSFDRIGLGLGFKPALALEHLQQLLYLQKIFTFKE